MYERVRDGIAQMLGVRTAPETSPAATGLGNDDGPPSEPAPVTPPAPAPHDPRPFARVLEPTAPWLEAAPIETLEKAFKGNHETISVASLDRCSPARVLAGFYGPSSRQIPRQPLYFRFAAFEALAAGADLAQAPADPPWPPDYSDAHYNLTGDQPRIAKHMVGLYREDGSRRVGVPRLEVLSEIADLLGRPDAEGTFVAAATKIVRRTFKLRTEREEIWIPLAEAHPHLLDDEQIQSECRKLYTKEREAWHVLAARLPRLLSSKSFSTGAAPR